MKILVYLAQSLDGYIAGPNGELDWLDEIDNSEADDCGFSAFMASVDALLMGRNTFEKVMSFDIWPYHKPVFVASNTLQELPKKILGKAFILAGGLTSMLLTLEKDGYNTIYLDGGKLIQSALQQNLIDELTLTTMPVTLGDGIPLFNSTIPSKKLKLLNSEILLGQMV